MEKKFKICLACTSTPVEGCESMTEAEVFDWLSIHDEKLDEPNECGDTPVCTCNRLIKKFIVIYNLLIINKL